MSTEIICQPIKKTNIEEKKNVFNDKKEDFSNGVGSIAKYMVT